MNVVDLLLQQDAQQLCIGVMRLRPSSRIVVRTVQMPFHPGVEQACGLELRAPGYPSELVAE